jgi:hypothetical protein
MLKPITAPENANPTSHKKHSLPAIATGSAPDDDASQPGISHRPTEKSREKLLNEKAYPVLNRMT